MKNYADDQAVLSQKELEMSKVQNLFESLKNQDAADAEALALCQKKYEVMCTGMEVNEQGQAETLKEQFMSNF